MGGAFSVNTFDLFSEPVHFSFEKKTYFKTTCGGLASLIQVIMLLLYLYYLIDELITRKIPIIVDSSNILEYPSNISFSKDVNFENADIQFNQTESKLVFYNAFGIYKNSYSIYIPLTNDIKKYLNLEIKQIQIDENGVINRTSINYEPCRKFANYKDKFVSLGLQRMYCLNDNYELQGNVNQPNSKSVEVKLKKCQNSKENAAKGISCYSEAEIKSYVKDIQLEWYFDNPVLNTTSVEIEGVLSSNLEQKYWDILSDFTKKCTILIGLDKIKLYNSYLPDFLYSAFSLLTFPNIRDFNTEISDANYEGSLLEITFGASNLMVIYERRYIDILAQMATLGGMIDVLFLMGFIFVWHISKEKINEKLVNSFYHISDPDETSEKSLLYKLKALDNVGANADNSINNNEQIKNNLNEKKNNYNGEEFDDYIRNVYNLHRDQAMKDFYKNFVDEETKIDFDTNKMYFGKLCFFLR